MPIVPVPSTISIERRVALGAAEGSVFGAPSIWPRALALVGAVALHAVALAALVIAVHTTPGSSGSVLEAIEVEIVDGSVLAAREFVPTKIVTGALADVGRSDGAPDAADGAYSLSATTPAEPPAPVGPPDTEARSEPALDQKALLEDDRREAEKTTEPRPVEAVLDYPTPAGADAGSSGSAARAQDTTPVIAAAAPVRAVAGDVRAYAQSVSAALARSRPRGGAGNGVSRVVFTIDHVGGLADVTVSRSSGNARLDTLAIEAVRRTRFAAPPPTFSIADRTFEVPYTFR